MTDITKIENPVKPTVIISKINELVDTTNNKQDTLVSGTNIKTVGGNSLLGSGNIAIPTVNNATLTVTQGGVSKGTFTANASSDVTIALDAGTDVEAYTASEVQTIWNSTTPYNLTFSISGYKVPAPTVTVINGNNTMSVSNGDIITVYGECTINAVSNEGNWIYISINNENPYGNYGLCSHTFTPSSNCSIRVSTTDK